MEELYRSYSPTALLENCVTFFSFVREIFIMIFAPSLQPCPPQRQFTMPSQVWTTSHAGDKFFAANLGTPSQALGELLHIFNLDYSSEKTGVRVLWTYIRDFFRSTKTQAELKSLYKLVTNSIGHLQVHILGQNYQQSSRARWPCTCRTMLKYVAGTIRLVLYGSRIQLRQLLPMAPEGLHAAAAKYAEGDLWPGQHQGLESYLDSPRTLR